MDTQFHKCVFLTNLAQTDCVATAFFFFFLLTLILATTGTSKHYSISWCSYWGTAPQTPPAIYKHTAVHKWDFFLGLVRCDFAIETHSVLSQIVLSVRREKKRTVFWLKIRFGMLHALLSCLTTNLMGYHPLVDFYHFYLTKYFPIMFSQRHLADLNAI